MWSAGDGGRSPLQPVSSVPASVAKKPHRCLKDGVDLSSPELRSQPSRLHLRVSHMTCFDCIGFCCRLWSFLSRKKLTTAHLRPDESEHTVPLNSCTQPCVWLVGCMRPSVSWDYGTAWVGVERTGWTNLRPLGECSYRSLLQIFPVEAGVLASGPWSGCTVSRRIFFSPTLRNI